MKKFLFALLLLPALVWGQQPFEFEALDKTKIVTVTDNTAAAADSLNVEGRVIAKFILMHEKLSLTLDEVSRGANDSLVLHVQTTALPSDTTTWQTVATIGPGVSTTLFYNRTLPTGVAARDTVLALHRYFRIYEDHSIAAWTAADTSSYRVFLRPWGPKF